MHAVSTPQVNGSVDPCRLKRAHRRLVVAILAALSTVALSACGSDASSKVAQPLVGSTVDGTSWKLSDQKGSWVVVAFQAEWCVPCRKEIKELSVLKESHPDVQIVTVGFMETVEQTRNFVKTTGISWTTIPDPDGDISSKWKVTAIPAAFLIDPSGQPLKKYIGSLTEDTIAAAIDKATANKGPQ